MVRVDPRVAWQAVAGQVIVLDLTTGSATGLNELGTFIWPRLGSETESEIVEAIVGEFEVDETTAALDLSRFVALLESKGYLVRHPPS
jgi:hypothetical protein